MCRCVRPKDSKGRRDCCHKNAVPLLVIIMLLLLLLRNVTGVDARAKDATGDKKQRPILIMVVNVGLVGQLAVLCCVVLCCEPMEMSMALVRSIVRLCLCLWILILVNSCC